jgi:acetyl esterase/lipase
MGSSYFYLEFFLAWLSLLKTSGFRNPAIFSLEYTLVPDKSYPVQLLQTVAGYKHVLSLSRDPARICVSGDSAGATLILSLLLYLESITMDTLANITDGKEIRNIRPGLAVLISPWVTLVSPKDKLTAGDYLNPTTLHQYAYQYANKALINSSLVSPGNCKNAERWKIASPAKGFFVHYGSEEVLAQEIRDLVVLLKSAGIAVESWEEKGGIHAWPVAALFLSSMYYLRLTMSRFGYSNTD